MPKVAFTQRDVQALIRAAKAEGCEHPSVDILPGGGLRLLTAPDMTPKAPLSDLERWEQAHGHGDA